MQQTPVTLRKTRLGKSHDYRDVIIVENLHFKNVFHRHKNEELALSNSSGFKSGFETRRSRDATDWCGQNLTSNFLALSLLSGSRGKTKSLASASERKSK